MDDRIELEHTAELEEFVAQAPYASYGSCIDAPGLWRGRRGCVVCTQRGAVNSPNMSQEYILFSSEIEARSYLEMAHQYDIEDIADQLENTGLTNKPGAMMAARQSLGWHNGNR